MTAPAPRIKTALQRAADLATEKRVVVEVSAGNVTYRVIPDIQQPNAQAGKPIDAPDDVRF